MSPLPRTGVARFGFRRRDRPRGGDLGIGLIPWRSAPTEGQVRIDVGQVPKDAIILVDGTKYEPGRLAEPLTMPFGSHDVEVVSAPHQPYKSSFLVEGPTRGPVIVILTPKPIVKIEPPTPKPEPKPEPEKVVAAPPPPPIPRVPEVVAPHYVRISENQREVENVELGALYKNPDMQSGKVVSPPSLFLVHAGGPREGQGDGTSMMGVTRVTLHPNLGNLHVLKKLQSFRVRADDRLLAEIDAMIQALPKDRRGAENASVLTFHVEKRIEGNRESWEPVLKKMESITWLDHNKIASKHFKGVVKSVVISTEGIAGEGWSQRSWSERLVAYSGLLRNFPQGALTTSHPFRIRAEASGGLLLASVSLLALLTLGGTTPATAAAPKRPPNILLIFSDDHASRAIGAYGHGLNATPHLDRLAREGTLFRHCLVTNSICGPSRATILTGKYSHLNGFYRNGDRFDGGQDTFAKRLRNGGYQTAFVGKWHLESNPTGFDHWEILPGQGVYYNPPMIADGRRVRHQGYTTEVITGLALDWLKSARDPSKPFLLMCQHKAPHRPWEPNLDKLDLYESTTFPEPPTLFDDYRGRTAAAKDQDMTIARTMTDLDLKLTTPDDLDPRQRKAWDAAYGPRNEAFRKSGLTGKDLVRWKYQRYMKDYLRCVSSLDDSVGKLLAYLDASGLAENTLVVYASDQGFYLGEHGWFDKRWMYEESLQTPLIVRWPGVARAGATNTDLVSNLDLAETFLEAAGLPIPPAMQGRSLVPVLKGETPADWRKSFYYHYYEYPVPHRVRPHEGVRTDRHKLIHFYGSGDWELYDLIKDPHELSSVYGDPAYAPVVATMKAELVRLRAEYRVPPNGQPPARPNTKPGVDRPKAGNALRSPDAGKSVSGAAERGSDCGPRYLSVSWTDEPFDSRGRPE